MIEFAEKTVAFMAKSRQDLAQIKEYADYTSLPPIEFEAVTIGRVAQVRRFVKKHSLHKELGVYFVSENKVITIVFKYDVFGVHISRKLRQFDLVENFLFQLAHQFPFLRSSTIYCRRQNRRIYYHISQGRLFKCGPMNDSNHLQDASYYAIFHPATQQNRHPNQYE